MRLIRFEGDEPQVVAKAPSPQVEFSHFRNVTSSVTQDALNVWADIWGELENGVACGVAVTPETETGFKPSCGWPEFLAKMWLLRHYLEFVARFSRQ